MEKSKKEAALNKIFLDTILEQRKRSAKVMKDLPAVEGLGIVMDAMEHITDLDELCNWEDLTLGYAMVCEIWWALYGMDFSYDRLSLLHYKDFEKFVLFVKSDDFEILQKVDLGNSNEAKGYRSVLILFAIAELYFWIGAVWDRMAQFLNLFAFGIRNVDKSRDGWRQVFERFQANYGSVDSLANDKDYKTIQQLNNKVYEKVYNRRNMLAHKGSLVGRTQAKATGIPENLELIEKYILGKERWDFSNILSESKKLCEQCREAQDALFDFVVTFLTWKKSQIQKMSPTMKYILEGG
jgi:hypothetical protein